jgi:arginyl-tRNA synthetase
MIKHKLVELITQAAEEAQKQGKLPSVVLPQVSVEHPQNPEYGDYATSLPLKLARATSLKPLIIAERIREFIAPTPEISAITVAPPGFINFTLRPDWLARQVDDVLAAGNGYGSRPDSRVQIEFMSANPPARPTVTGGGHLGSTIARTRGYRPPGREGILH